MVGVTKSAHAIPEITVSLIHAPAALPLSMPPAGRRLQIALKPLLSEPRDLLQDAAAGRT